MKKSKIIQSALLLLCLLTTCGCSAVDNVNVSLSEEGSKEFALLFHDAYVNQFQIDIISFGQRNRVLSKAESLLRTEPHFLKSEGALLQESYYSITSDFSGSLYYGDLKNNKPNGLGVICDAVTGVYTYIGNFENGRYSGYGISFSNTSIETGNIQMAMQNGEISQETADALIYYASNFVTYEGEWKNGKRDGRGNEYMISSEVDNPPLEGFWAGDLYPRIYAGNFSKDKYDGEGKMFLSGYLLYEGECKDTEPNGKGIAYYSNGQKLYDGEWKNGRYHGIGTRYRSNGEVEYSGQWRNGDYA